MAGELVLRDIGKAYDGRRVVRDISLTVGNGEFVALLGPSGCGKSTILSIVAGFERPDTGTVSIDGHTVDDVPPHRRNLGLVMQDYALFPRMTVRQNLEFGLRMQSASRAKRRDTVAKFAERLALDNLLDRRSAELNLSEKQRVALARVLVTRPSLLLLDEPMSNLDAAVRNRLRSELKLIQRELSQTILYVTHDQIEAMSMADRIAVMREGAIEQTGTPADVYNFPRNRYVAQFLGEPPVNLLQCTIEQQSGDSMVCRVAGGAFSLAPGYLREGDAILAIRPHHVQIAQTSSRGSRVARVIDVENLGAERVLHMDYSGQHLTAISIPGVAAVGNTVYASLDFTHAHLFDTATGEVLIPKLREAAV
jgi:multiple sugar transport system ATP-binding protein